MSSRAMAQLGHVGTAPRSFCGVPSGVTAWGHEHMDYCSTTLQNAEEMCTARLPFSATPDGIGRSVGRTPNHTLKGECWRSLS